MNGIEEALVIFAASFLFGVVLTIILSFLDKMLGLKVTNKIHYIKTHQKVTLAYALSVIFRADFLFTVLLYIMSGMLVDTYYKYVIKE